ncbi:hypothetical protein BpHYR1_024729 [Brachionus plicatilis]|uniref:Uncharacterized protein n=1 Tax=Brachionus plicatilis TaxID=10195 RepID=A0A3M7PA48_BRAPC|nr:hypothetical protein BpHYR1_024729 [Brachionus plicatilis]
MSNKIDGHPFGSQSSRFTHNGVHPNRLATGKMPYQENLDAQISRRLGPGSYQILKYDGFSYENVSKNAGGANWEKSFLTEKYAKMPHLLYQENYKKKQEDKIRLGPAYYTLKDNIQLENDKPKSTKGIIDHLSERFSDKGINHNPGPGAYGIPDEILEIKRKNKPGIVPIIERSKESRSLPYVGSENPPGTYDHKNSIDELVKKKVSKRGPYDLFTGDRSAQKTGHLLKDTENKLGPGQYSLDSFVDLLSKPEQQKQGKFGKLSQYPNPMGDRIGMLPGPGYYDAKEPSRFVSKMPPFMSSSERSDFRYQKRLNKNYNLVGVGRYDLRKNEINEFGNGHQSVFNSKSAHMINKNKPYYTERIKQHNLPINEKLKLNFTGRIYDDITTGAQKWPII